MSSPTFHAYVLWRFAKTIFAVLIGILTLIFLIDFTEAIMELSDEDGFTFLAGLRLSFLRSFAAQDDILPFAFLWGAIIGLIGLSRRSELIVARAAGISIWGLLAMPVLFALAFGVASVMIFNPVAQKLEQNAKLLEDDLRGRDGFAKRGGFWLRQGQGDAASIVHAHSESGNAGVLHGVTVFVFAEDQNRFLRKITAERAEYTEEAWILREAVVTSANADQEAVSEYVLPTNLSADEVRRMLTRPDALSVLALARFIGVARASGLKTERFRYTLHELLARPFFLVAMVLLAATVSLKLMRGSNTGQRVLAGIIGGFLLYVSVEFLRDLAGNGIVEPAVAAWAPSIVALTLGATVMLYQEDG